MSGDGDRDDTTGRTGKDDGRSCQKISGGHGAKVCLDTVTVNFHAGYYSSQPMAAG